MWQTEEEDDDEDTNANPLNFRHNRYTVFEK